MQHIILSVHIGPRKLAKLSKCNADDQTAWQGTIVLTIAINKCLKAFFYKHCEDSGGDKAS